MSGLKYSVDIVMCIDSTGSMGHVIDLVKKNALRFEEDLQRVMAAKQKAIDALRIRVISFRDFGSDGKAALVQSKFFNVPVERDGFSSFVSGIQAHGGGDEPESALEALAVAMDSDWVHSGDKRRHVVVLWTDASAHRLEDAVGQENQSYPVGIPRSFGDLTALWEGQQMDQAAKRLLIYAPDLYPWPEIQGSWESVAHVASKAGEGLAEVDYGAVLEAIANSV
jgi:hypothetical protein